MAHRGVPHDSTLNYVSSGASSSAWTASGVVNLPRDLSAVNRQHWQHTNRKGVPLVYRVALTFSPAITDAVDSAGTTHSEVMMQDANQIQAVRVITASQNWVMRNASVKTHAARENMFRKSGVKKKERGAYAKTIHYTWDAAPGSFLSPYDGDAAAFTGGTWEFSKLIYPDDASGAYINLIDSHATEESNLTFTAVSLPQLYLSSRGQMEADTNTDVADQPAAFSILRKLLAPSQQGIQDEVTDEARDVQDNPPYDLAEDGDTTEPVESARLFLGVASGLQQTCVVDVPFGIFETKALNLYLDDGQNVTNGFTMKCEVIDVYEMGEF